MATNIEIADVLERAAERLSKPGAWIRGAYAKTATGAQCPPASQEAVCFCLVGAVAAELGVRPESAESILFKHPAIQRTLCGQSSAPSYFNDRATQEQVVAKLREAAAKAREGHSA